MIWGMHCAAHFKSNSSISTFLKKDPTIIRVNYAISVFALCRRAVGELPESQNRMRP